MVNACADPEFFVREGGGGSKPSGEKTALIVLCFFFFFFFFVQNFPGMRGFQLFTGGGGVQMLISIEFDRTCDYQGWGAD